MKVMKVSGVMDEVLSGVVREMALACAHVVFTSDGSASPVRLQLLKWFHRFRLFPRSLTVTAASRTTTEMCVGPNDAPLLV